MDYEVIAAIYLG